METATVADLILEANALMDKEQYNEAHSLLCQVDELVDDNDDVTAAWERYNAATTACQHPTARLYAWTAYDGTFCVCCCECGAVLKGGATL